MALKRVRYEDENETFRIEGGGEIDFASDGALVMPIALVENVSIAHFASALRRYEEYYGGHLEAIFISEASSATFDKNTSPRNCWVGYEKGRVSVEAGMLADPGRPPGTPAVVELVAPLLARHRARWGGMWTDTDSGHTSVGISAQLAGHARSLRELYDLGDELQLLLDAVSGDVALSARTASNLVKAGHIDVIRGHPEGIWLDAKRQPYALGTDAQAWEVAKDVAAFANTGADALIIIGVDTRRTPNGELLDVPRPFPIADMDVVALRAVLRDRITPVIPDLDVGVVESRGGYGYGWIFIPAQAGELHPFIVAGALIGSDWRGGHLSIPIRSVKDTVYLDAAAVHSMLAAGRIALRQNSPAE